MSNYDAFMPYFNVTEGLGRLANNKVLYVRLLKMFATSLTMEELKKELDAGNMPAAQIIVHSLKGTSANLSAIKLHEAALNLEQRIKGSLPYADEIVAYEEVMSKTRDLLPKLIEELSI